MTVVVGGPLPPGYSTLVGEPSRCLENAARYAGPKLAYWEGQARQPGEPWRKHAWLVNAQGQIVDVTPPWHLTRNEYDGRPSALPPIMRQPPPSMTRRADRNLPTTHGVSIVGSDRR
jgi:hypothetical protein